MSFVVQELRLVVCDRCLTAVADSGHEGDASEAASFCRAMGDDIPDHLCGEREGDLPDAETCLCRCNRLDDKLRLVELFRGLRR